MVVFYLRNSKAPDDKIVPLTISLQLTAVKPFNTPTRPDQSPTVSGVTPTGTGFPNLLDKEGTSLWLMVVAPPRDELDKDTGLPIPPEIINVVSEDNLHDEIEAAMGRIGGRVEWPPLRADTQAPQLLSVDPPLNATDVNILSNVIYRIIEPLPAAGLNLDTLHMTLNGFPIIVSGTAVSTETVDFRGNIFDQRIVFRPKRALN